MVWLTLLFAVVNICFGFALAVYLGNGSPGVLASSFPLRLVFKRKVNTPEPAAAPEPEAIPEPVAIEEPSESEEGQTPQEPKEVALVRPDTPEETAKKSRTPYNPLLNWKFDNEHVETSVLLLNVAIAKSTMKISDIDTNLRESLGHSTEELVTTSLEALKDDCNVYLQEQREAIEKVLGRSKEFGNMRALCDEIEMANLSLAAQVETSLSNLNYMDFKTDFETANRRLLEEIKNLKSSRDRLRDDNELAFLKIARYENRLDKIAEPLQMDPITGLVNRFGLEAKLYDWWRQGISKKHEMTAILLDIDHFTSLNEHHGLFAGDCILREFGRLLKSFSGQDGLTGKYAGQQFFGAILDVEPQTAVQNIDVFRQSLEKTTFIFNNNPIRITVGGAIVDVVSYHTYIALFEKMEEIMKDVKKAGPNRLMYFNGRAIEQVDYANVEVEETEIVVES